MDNPWNEVCEAMVEVWNELSPAKKAAKSTGKLHQEIVEAGYRHTIVQGAAEKPSVF